MILEIDPDFYDARYRKALTDRRLVHYLDADGAAVVTATGLPADEAAAAMRRVDDLARAARRTGHPGTLDQIRTDVFLMLLDGSVHGLTRTEIIDALFGRYAGHAQGTPPGGATECQPGDHDQTTAAQDTTASQGAASQGTASQGTASQGTASRGPTFQGAAAAGSDPGSPHPATDGPGNGGPAGPAPDGDDGRAHAGVGAGDQRVGIEIRVPLLTLLGLAERAGQLPGLGPVTAATARAVVARAGRAQWRWAVLDPDGRLLTEGLTRHRPAHPDPHRPRGGIVELQIGAPDLARLAADPTACGRWAALVADIARQHARRPDPNVRSDLDAHPEDRFPRVPRCAATSRSATAPAVTPAAALPPAPPTSTTPSTTPAAAPPSATTSGRLAATTTPSRPAAAGPATNPNPAGSSGPAPWAAPTVRPEPILLPAVTTTPRASDPFHDRPAEHTDRPLIAQPGPPRAPPPDSPPGDSYVLDLFTLDGGSPVVDTEPPPF